MIKKCLFIALFSSILISSKQCEDFQTPLTLSELVSIALDNHPSTRQTWWNAHRAASILGQAKSAYYPKIDLESNVRNGRDFKFLNGPDTNYTIAGADLVLSMMLYDFGERNAQVNSAKMSLLAANWHAEWTIQKVIIKVLENAYSTLHAEEVWLAARSSLEDSEKIFHSARELNRTGLTPISDLYIAQANLSEMKMELSQQKALFLIQKGRLASSLGLSANASFELTPLNEIQAPQKEDIHKLLDIALKRRADLMEKQARLSESLANLNKTRAAHKPKLSFLGRGGANHALHDKANAAQYGLTLNLEIPLFNGFETTYKNRIAIADTKISEEELIELQLDISLEVLTHSLSLQAAQEMLPEAKENLENSLKAYESVLEKYKAGKEGMTEMSIAQRQLAAARIRYSDVKTRWFLSLANLAYATGTLAPNQEATCTTKPY